MVKKYSSRDLDPSFLEDEQYFIDYEDYKELLQDYLLLKYGPCNLRVAKLTGSSPQEVSDFAHKELNDKLMGVKDKRGMLAEDHVAYFKGLKLNKRDISSILIKR